MAKILIKRGLQTNVDNLTLEYGELALAYNEEKTSIALYGGGEGGEPILINPDVSGDVAGVLAQAQEYADGKVNDLVDGAPEAMDTLKELADAIAANKGIMDALNAAIGNKVDKEAGKSLVSDTEKAAWNAKLSANSTIDGGTF